MSVYTISPEGSTAVEPYRIKPRSISIHLDFSHAFILIFFMSKGFDSNILYNQVAINEAIFQVFRRAMRLGTKKVRDIFTSVEKTGLKKE